MLKIEFTKKSWMKFISHLDLLRLFQRVFRRADFSLKLSSGFSPHPLVFFKRALKLGLESDSEYASVVLDQEVSLDDVKIKINSQLPEGIKIKEVVRVENNSKNHGL